MNKGNDILQELQSMNSILADIPRIMPYAVPDDYFNRFITSIHEQIQIEQTPDPVTVWSKINPYIAPDGYFENFADKIADNVLTTSVSIAHNDPYEVPDGYFDTLPARSLTAAKDADKQQPTRIISLRRNMWKQVRWAAAAVLLIGLGVGSYEIVEISQPHHKAERMLASIPDKDISEYIQQNIDDFDLDMIVSNTNISDEDIAQYLNETGVDTSKVY